MRPWQSFRKTMAPHYYFMTWRFAETARRIYFIIVIFFYIHSFFCQDFSLKLEPFNVSHVLQQAISQSKGKKMKKTKQALVILGESLAVHILIVLAVGQFGFLPIYIPMHIAILSQTTSIMHSYTMLYICSKIIVNLLIFVGGCFRMSYWDEKS